VRIHPFNQSPILQTDTVARPSALSFIVAGFVVLLFPCIGLFMVRSGAGAFGWWVLSAGMCSDGVLCIEFFGAIAWIFPHLRSTLHQFSDYGVTILPKISEVIDFTRAHADNKKLDDEILRLAQSGQTLPAIEMTRKRYGYSLAQARQFVQDLITPARK